MCCVFYATRVSNYLLNTLSPLLFNKGGRIFCSEFVEVETWRERHELPSGAGARDRRCTLVPVSPVQPPARCYSKAPAQRKVEERARQRPTLRECGVYMGLRGIICAAGERERGREREGERERNTPKHRQTHSTAQHTNRSTQQESIIHPKRLSE